MSSESEADAPVPTFKQHYYPCRYASLKTAGRPVEVFIPGCCGHSGGSGASTSAAGAALGASQGCDIIKKGWQDMGHVCEVKGVYPLKARKYYCKTHNKIFTHFSPDFAGWLYAQQGPGGCSMWDHVRPEPLIIQHARTYLSADLLSSLVIQYENGTEVYGLVTSMQEMWLAEHLAHASQLHLSHTATGAVGSMVGGSETQGAV